MESNELRNYALRLQGIIDAAIDGIITIDSRGLVQTINNAAASQFQYSPDEVIGNNIKMLMPQPYRKEHDGYLMRYKETKVPRIIGIGREVTGLKKSGVTFPFSLSVSEVILHDRVIYTGIIHDLTEVKKAQNNLIQLNKNLELKVIERTEELEEAVNGLLAANKKMTENEQLLTKALNKEKELNELKSRFVSMASHEFRTPLSTILSSAALIGRYTQTEQNENRVKHIDKIKSAVSNLTGILNDFLSLSKIEEGKEVVVKEDVQVDDICRTVISEVEGLLDSNQNIEYAESNAIIRTDPRILKNILFNLVSNAIKYSKGGTAVSTIQILITKRTDATEFKIIDNGIGIPQYDQEHLFSRFFRASNVENIQGTGLGLNIVKRYVELLNGEINFSSKEGSGTTFNLTFPNP
jgi:PAS domain S-box-containing protein